jgi:hypothetical protein
MADLIDVLNALETVVLTTVYPPDGTVPPGGVSSLIGCAITTTKGKAAATLLDRVAASLLAGSPEVLVEIMNRPGMSRNTTRFPQQWQQQVAPTTTLIATVDPTGRYVTIGGTPPGADGPAQNIALILRFGSSPNQAFAYSVQPSDTLDTIASELAALVDVETAASASGAVVTIPAAFGLIARVGGVATALKPLKQFLERVDLRVWAPACAPTDPQWRDLVAKPILIELDQTKFLTLADGLGARIIRCADFPFDDPEKAGLFGRWLAYDIEYSTTITMPAPQAIAPSADLQGAPPPFSEFTETDPPVVVVEA